MSMYVTIELLGGSDIGATLDEMRALADRIGVTVHAKFNDVGLYVKPNADLRDAVERYHEEVKKPHTQFAMVWCHPA